MYAIPAKPRPINARVAGSGTPDVEVAVIEAKYVLLKLPPADSVEMRSAKGMSISAVKLLSKGFDSPVAMLVARPTKSKPISEVFNPVPMMLNGVPAGVHVPAPDKFAQSLVVPTPGSISVRSSSIFGSPAKAMNC